MEYAPQLASLRDMTENEQVIRSLYAITSSYEQSLQQRIERLLQLGCQRFGLDIGILSHVVGDEYKILYHTAPEGVPLSNGDCFSVQRTYCIRALTAKGPVGFEHVAQSDFATHPAYKDFGLESYIGAPVMVNDEVYGTLNFSSPNPSHKPFDLIDIDALQLMTNWIGTEITKDMALQELSLSNQKLKKAEAILAQVVEVAPACIIMINENGDIELVNQETERMFGYGRDELLGEKLEILLPLSMRGSHAGMRNQFMRNLDSRIMAGRELFARKKSGEEFPVEIGLNSVKAEGQSWVLSAVIDITERKRYENEIIGQKKMLEQVNELLATQANTDSLTGLFNRRVFFDKLTNLLDLFTAKSKPISILLLDLDYFKQINDTYGHNKGDQVLKELAIHLKAQARDSDLVARYGGEEFVIVLPETDQLRANRTAERLCKKIEAVDFGCPVTVSIGVATLSDASPNKLLVDDFVEQADQALYASKIAGRNRTTHFQDIAQNES